LTSCAHRRGPAAQATGPGRTRTCASDHPRVPAVPLNHYWTSSVVSLLRVKSGAARHRSYWPFLQYAPLQSQVHSAWRQSAANFRQPETPQNEWQYSAAVCINSKVFLIEIRPAASTLNLIFNQYLIFNLIYLALVLQF